MGTINELVKEYLDRELLRFTTAGSVDDGKSTLIGRLLYDSKAIFVDQLEALEMASKRRGEEQINLALLTDGLKAEREQGITIDVAYRYFSTPKRKFIIADTPGHIQYTRNMVTGASTANVAIILIDARNGVVEQTIRHSFIASLLNIPHIIVCVNKMDLVDYSEHIFNKICQDYESISSKISVKDIRFIPISALKGDNVVNKSDKMPWYDGPSLMHLLETIHITNDINYDDPRFPVQYVIRPNTDEFHDYRGYAGRIASGIFRVGDAVTVLPSGFTSRIKSIDFFGESLQEAYAPQSVAIQIEDDIDISRGDMLVRSDNLPTVGQDVELMICWLNEKPMQVGNKYYLRHTTTGMRCIVKEIIYKVDINTLEELSGGNTLQMNEIAKIRIRTSQPLVYNSYHINRTTGSLILIDEGTNETVGAGMIK
ncbi:MAG TPA: sulfate adenylyltransferase subunit CysN [Bacteroidales bacterium]|nr:sulfate adenylyltransferase subunit CysN [Bacteroidales bacterium]HPO64622.1 sulfate adenylyltransferase subunit CysN [Bacteroidales bacterium]